MQFKSYLPAWSYSAKKKKEAQTFPLGDPDGEGLPQDETFPLDEKPKMVRYRGTMMYEIEVPANPDQEKEQAVAEAKAHDLWMQIRKSQGDNIQDYNPPNRIG